MTALSSIYEFGFCLEVKNGTKWFLDPYSSYEHSGQISSPPGCIWPGERGTLIAHKAGVYGQPATYGVSGVVSWKFKDKSIKLALMYNLPHDQDGAGQKNKIALGLFPASVVGKNCMKEVYFKLLDAAENHPGENLSYKTGSFQGVKAGEVIQYATNGLEIIGTIGSGDVCDIKVDVRPKLGQDAAPNLRELFLV